MKGSVTKKGSKYYIIVDIGRDNTGKRKQKWYGGFKTKKEAEKELIKVLNQIENNTFINPDKITVSEYLKQWLYDYVEKNLAPVTIESYRTNIEKHIIPCLGLNLLQKMQPIHIQQFYNEMLVKGRTDGKGGLSPKSVLYLHRILREAINHALKLQLVNRNVVDLVEPPRQKSFKAKFLNENQVQILLDTLKYTNLYIPTLLAVGLGLRRGEALGLKWDDIDFEDKTITISRSLLPSQKGVIFHDPKTEKSNRVIIAPNTILLELQKLKDKQQEHKDLLGDAYKKDNLVCCYNDGSYFNPATFSGLFLKALRRYKLEEIRFHDLRHTNATLMLKHNIPAKVASERLGHSGIGITLDLYSHVMKEMQEEAANKIEKAIFNN